MACNVQGNLLKLLVAVLVRRQVRKRREKLFKVGKRVLCRSFVDGPDGPSDLTGDGVEGIDDDSEDSGEGGPERMGGRARAGSTAPVSVE